MKPLVDIVHEGEPVAAPRPRMARNGRTYNPSEYTAYKALLQATIHSKYGYWSWDVPESSHKRAKWMARNRYKLTAQVYRSVNRGDIDNFTKTILDALQAAGVLVNDSQVDHIDVTKHIDKERPRVELKLWEVTG